MRSLLNGEPQNAYSDLSDTILGNKIAAEIHLQEEDFEDTIKASKRGLRVLKQFEIDSGKTLRKSVVCFIPAYILLRGSF